MKIFKKKRQNHECSSHPRFCCAENFSPYKLAADSENLESGIYDSLRGNLPVIDACICKIVRLCGDFSVIANDEKYQSRLDNFCMEVPVGISGKSIFTFADMYLDSLLTYGKAIGRIYADRKSLSIKGLFVEDSSMYRIGYGENPLEKKFYSVSQGKEINKENMGDFLYTALNPNPKHPEGVSILRGLPAISHILAKIYRCIGQNFDRVGNVRYAVTYKPSEDGGDGKIKERAMEMADAWSKCMNESKNGTVKDFVAVGDVDIKVIGAENQLIDTEIPVRQLLEQIVAKLSVPPFLLGLNWSTTERMSSQQADILTSELEYYRRLLNPVIKKICDVFLQLNGSEKGCIINWNPINLQDEEGLARAKLYDAQAERILLETNIKKGE